MSDTDFSETTIAPDDNGSEHGINFALKLRSPVPGRFKDRVEMSFEIKYRVEARILAGIEPGLADEHNSPPSIFSGETGEDVDETLVS